MPTSINPHGPVAEAIATTWWIMLGGATAVLVLVMALLLYAVYRRPARRMELRWRSFVAIGGIVFPTLTLTALLVYGTAVGRAIVMPSEHPLRVEVTAHQWWWELHYPATSEHAAFTTANELHVPVGVPVEISLRSADVIHSFWVPALGGKVDLIPGRVNTHRIEAGSAGVFRGQCAEFCGAQHAKMGLLVIAELPADFDRWRERRAADAENVPGEGEQTFLQSGCAGCHAVRGTGAAGDIGPDLTHIASRRMLGAATLDNDPAGLRQWIANHGGEVKSGNRGPYLIDLDASTVDELADYLEGLR